MASAVAALKKALLVAVCALLLLHSSMAQAPQPPTTSPPPPPPPHACSYTGQQPPPSPTPPPPTPPASSPPAPSPVSNCSFSDCGSQCDPSCKASYAPMNCTVFLVGPFNGCYDSCTNHTCPGKSCVHSGCGYITCSCHNPHAVRCCESCRSAVPTNIGSPYERCRSYNDRYMMYCMTSCIDMCSKNCPNTSTTTQQGA